MRMTVRLLSRFTTVFVQAWTRPAPRILPLLQVKYSSNAAQRLERCVETELELERASFTKLPVVSGFETTVTGSLATLQRSHGQNQVTVELDANHAIEVTSEEDDGEEEDLEVGLWKLAELTESSEMLRIERGSAIEIHDKPFFVPAFTVTVKKPSGDSLQLECSFDEFGSYNEYGREWDSMKIDAISVLPSQPDAAESVYTAESRNLSEELNACMLDYLKECGVNEEFTKQILEFYTALEHSCYCKNFLEGLQKFIH